MSDDITFQGESPNEKIIFVLHRHPWTLFASGAWIVIILWIMSFVFLRYQGSWVTSWVMFLGLPVALYIAANAWFRWTNSMYMLTNERLLAVNQLGWFSRSVSEIAIGDIMKISHEIKGASATMFNFGDVNIVASGASESDLVLSAVYDPYEVQQQIIRTKKGLPPQAETDTDTEAEDEK